MSDDLRNGKVQARKYFVANRGSDSENDSEDDKLVNYNPYQYSAPYHTKLPPHDLYDHHPPALRTDFGSGYIQDHNQRPSLSSPSSASSHAAEESTPPPSTPGASLPPPSQPTIPPKPTYQLQDSHTVNDRHPPDAHPSSRSVSHIFSPLRNWRNGISPRTAVDPNPVRRPRTSPSSSTPDSAVSSNSALPNQEKVIVCVTTYTDQERLYIVDVSGAKDASYIRGCILSKTNLVDGGEYRHSIYLTEIGASTIGDPLTDEKLLNLVLSQGDAKGTLKFFVSRSPREQPPPAPFPYVEPTVHSVLPLRPKRRSRSRQGSVSSIASEQPAELGYDADLDNPEDSRKMAARQQPHSHITGASASPPSPGPRRRQPTGPLPPQPPSSSLASVTTYPHLQLHTQSQSHLHLHTHPPSPTSQNSTSKPPTPPNYFHDRPHLLPGPRQTFTDRFGQVVQTPPPPPPLSPRRDIVDESHSSHSPMTHIRSGSDAGAQREQLLIASEQQQYDALGQQRRTREPMSYTRLKAEPSRDNLLSSRSSRKIAPTDGELSGWTLVEPSDSNIAISDPPRSAAGPSRSKNLTSSRHRSQLFPSLSKPSPVPMPSSSTDSRTSASRPSASKPIYLEKAIRSKPPDSWPKGTSASAPFKSIVKGKSMDNLRQYSFKGSSTKAPVSQMPTRPPIARDATPYLSTSSYGVPKSYEPPRAARPLPVQGSLYPQSPDSNRSGFQSYSKSSPYISTSLSTNLTSPNRDPFPRPQSAADNHSTSPTYQQRPNHSPSFGSSADSSRSPGTMSPSRSFGVGGPRPLHHHTHHSDRSSDVPSGHETPNPTPPRTPTSPTGSKPSPAGKVPLVVEPSSPISESVNATFISDVSSADSEMTIREDDKAHFAAMLNNMNVLMSSERLHQLSQSEISTAVNDLSSDEEDYEGSGGTWIKPYQDSSSIRPELTKLQTDLSSNSEAVHEERKPSTSISHSHLQSHQVAGAPSGHQQRPPYGNRPGDPAADRPLSGYAIDRDDWAPRPLPEDVYDRLEEFFPEHDLDKLVIEANSGGNSPTNVEPTTVLLPPVSTSATVMQTHPAKRHKKSIRIVAEEQKKRLNDRASKVDSTYANNALLRKRNTKMWGSKLEELTTMQVRTSSTIPESPSSASPSAPTFKWVRGELLGRGTYGRVYLALNATTGEMIAVKQVELPQTPSDRNDSRQTTVVQALKLESETLKDLDHPHIVQYLGFEETPTNLSIFLEYVPGGSVGSCLHKHGKFSEDVTKSFTSQILSGLEYLHSKGIIHRDLKADNILVEMSGICKISDFGISKRTDDLQGGAFTAMQGTVFWMAPEVINTQKKGYNFKIDIWSVGCVVLEMWGGRRPWTGQEMVAVMFKLYEAKLPPPVPDDVILSELGDDFRRKCFAINPDERPSAAELRLHRYLELHPGWTFTSFT